MVDHHDTGVRHNNVAYPAALELDEDRCISRVRCWNDDLAFAATVVELAFLRCKNMVKCRRLRLVDGDFDARTGDTGLSCAYNNLLGFYAIVEGKDSVRPCGFSGTQHNLLLCSGDLSSTEH